MRNVEYHVEEFHGNFNPNISENEFAGLSIRLEVGDARLENDDVLTADYNLEVILNEPGSDHEESFDDIDPDYGDFSIDYVLRYQHDPNQIEDDIELADIVDTWNSDGYDNIPNDLISLFELDLVPKLLVPIDRMISDSFLGIAPRYQFTVPENISEEEEGNNDDN